ncbi:MAG: hypothetical protein CVU77_08725 [Elusimicrobia bacterium HGW-Elusimicrobia-1]|jgi:hypothetical protein|nr:MAG: hypothetical protein CVU77_08725 [Elusimicrobia bacterium HGW-Elusimicrobia-1]
MSILTKNTATYAILSALLAMQIATGIDAARKNSQTYDEAVHLAAGYSYYVTSSFEMNAIDHPPLAKLIAALPLVFIKPDFPSASHPWRADMQGNQYRIGDFFLYKNRLDADRLLGAGRGAMIALAALFTLALFLCAKKSFGRTAALASTAFWVFYPAAAGNSFLITTDYAATAFFFLAAFSFREALGEVKGYFWSVTAGAAAGAALAAKFSMITLPVSLAAVFILAVRNGDVSGSHARKAVAAVAAASAVVWASYFFSNPEYFFRGLDYTLRSAALMPRASFLMGEYTVGGWLYYFPAAFILKTPATMIAAAVAYFFLKKKPAKADYVDGKSVKTNMAARNTLYLTIPAMVFFVAACFSKIQIGHRHILPVYPFIVLFAGAGAAALLRKNAYSKILAVFLLASCAAEFAAVHPWHISYFSHIFGGPSRGHKYLLDSNLDWGQGLSDLSAFLKTRGVDGIYLSYFGTADPGYHGIKYRPVGFITNVPRGGSDVNISARPQKYLAVSATNLFANYYADKNIFGPLRDIKPVYTAAHSIYVYDLADDRVREYLAALYETLGEEREAARVRALFAGLNKIR